MIMEYLMGFFTVKIPDKIDKEFRQAVSAKHDHVIKKGDIQDAFAEAIKEWTEKNKPSKNSE